MNQIRERPLIQRWLTRVERFFCNLNPFRRIASRCEIHAANFLAAIAAAGSPGALLVSFACPLPTNAQRTGMFRSRGGTTDSRATTRHATLTGSLVGVGSPELIPARSASAAALPISK